LNVELQHSLHRLLVWGSGASDAKVECVACGIVRIRQGFAGKGPGCRDRVKRALPDVREEIQDLDSNDLTGSSNIYDDRH
jgi:hypothetical protein